MVWAPLEAVVEAGGGMPKGNSDVLRLLESVKILWSGGVVAGFLAGFAFSTENDDLSESSRSQLTRRSPRRDRFISTRLGEVPRIVRFSVSIVLQGPRLQ